MLCVKIIGVPSGQAPDWVRQAWVGLVLPLDALNPFAEAGDIGKGVLDGARVVSQGGYNVDAISAIEVLELTKPDAALWWRENTNWVRPGVQLEFCEEACELVESLPGILPATDDGRITFQQFLWLLCPSEFDLVETVTIHRPVEGYVMCGCGPNWPILQASPINRVLIKAVANVIATEYAKLLMVCTDEIEYRQDQEEGHYVLQRLHRLAVEYGVDVRVEEIDHPLDMRDFALQIGMVQEVEGELKLTEKGRRFAHEMLLRANAPNN